MKIGLVIYGSLETLSGGYLYDRKLVEYLRGQGDEVEIFSLRPGNYPVHLLDNLRFRLPADLDLLIQDELNHPSLLLANRRTHPYPVISLVHHLRSSEQHPYWQKMFYQFIEERYLKSVDGFIFNSETTKSVVENHVGHKKPHVVAFPPTDRFGEPVSPELVEKRAQQPGPLKLLFIGNIIPRKGLHTLLVAVQNASVDLHLDVVGSTDVDPTYVEKMVNITAATSLAPKISFHGPLMDPQLISLLKKAHVLVVPSSYEGFGIVYLEGMAFGLPAIGTYAGGAVEIIEDEKTGFLIGPDDSYNLSKRLTRLANDRDLLAQMSINALERYRQQTPWTETAGKIRGFLQNQVLSFSGSRSEESGDR